MPRSPGGGPVETRSPMYWGQHENTLRVEGSQAKIGQTGN